MRKASLIIAMLVCLVAVSHPCRADTFTHSQRREVLHGYATSQTEDGQTSVQTQEKGLVKLNLAEWEITSDRLGRNNKVIILPVENEIMLEIETSAFAQAVVNACDEGPVLILLEIDTPGGQIDLAQRMCAAITKTANCSVVAYIKGGEYGGAISAGAALALACDEIHMANNTVIGGATLISTAKIIAESNKIKYDEAIDEKMSSIWRAYLASLAEQNQRPGLLARAMVDRDIEVVEVTQGGKRLFIEPANKRPGQQPVREWSKRGSLLTLTAEEALKCSIADGLAETRRQLLGTLNAGDAEVVVDETMGKARRELERARRNIDEIRKSLDLKLKESQYSQPLPKVLGILRGARDDFETLIALGKKYQDLHVDVRKAEEDLNSVNAAYERILRERKRRR